MYRKKLSESSTEELVRTDADSGRDPAVGSTQHLQIRSGQLAGDWTRDPPRIVYIDRPAGPTSWKIAALPLVPGGKPVLIEDTGIVKFGPRVSPSGRWVAYASDESGGFEIYVRSMPNRGKPAGPRIRISTGGGANAAWSADGRTLFYNSPDDRLLSVPLKVDGDRLEAGEPKAMFALGGSSSYNGAAYWEPIGNGERFVVLRSTQVTGRDNRINILVNWQAGLD
jgi:Tol biopolymer transport system component